MKLIFCATFLLFTMSAVAQNAGGFDTKSVDDIASVAVMLATNDYMTGQTVSVNGGWYMS
ncbi:MAG: hypothetical protein WAU58_06185 [Terriglobales bacterium]